MADQEGPCRPENDQRCTTTPADCGPCSWPVAPGERCPGWRECCLVLSRADWWLRLLMVRFPGAEVIVEYEVTAQYQLGS